VFENILLTVAILSGINGVLAVILVVAEKFFADYGECRVRINKEKEFTVKGGASLLATLNSQKIFLPSACGGRGTCAYCKCRVLEGGGPVLPTEESLLTEEEIGEQFRLACQLKVKKDISLAIPVELLEIQEFKAEVVLLEDLTYDIKRVRLKLIEPDRIQFIPGQYIQLRNAPYPGMSESVSRAYSIASSSFSDSVVDLMVRLIPEGIVTTWVHQYLKVGDPVTFTGPMGDFCLHQSEGSMIMVAGGSGMAPMVSMLHKIRHEKIDREIIYLFGAVTEKDLFFMKEMREFVREIPGFSFIPALSAPAEPEEWKGETGLITLPLEKTLARLKDTGQAQGYLCGSPGMIKACIQVFKQHGVTGERIFYDPFA
jgi:Na+-transporting NADH:ubiquinone oxidoreductase subunit F